MEPLTTVGLVLLLIVVIFLLITIVKTTYTVRTYTAGVVERFGKFNRIAQPGLHLLVPWCETVRFVDLQVKQADVSVETKSRDNVFVTIPVSIQYQVLPEKIFEAYYSYALTPSTRLSLDYQFVSNPGYNADRGPANVFAGRVHWQF